MSTDEMRHYLDLVGDRYSIIHEGILDSIKNWVQSLGNPVKQRGQELTAQLASQLRSKYSATVPQQTQKSNKDWMWAKLSYKNLYDFAKHSGFTDNDIDRALKNPIVTNNLKQLFRTLPADTVKPTLPLSGATIKNNTGFISATIDKQTRQYLSKAIATAVIDGLSYIEQSAAADNEKQPQSQTPTPTAATKTAEPEKSPTTGSGPSENPEQIKQAVDKIKTYLASKEGVV
jgi:hypothetical protein